MWKFSCAGTGLPRTYATYCLHYADGALAELSFANASRGDDSEPYIGYGYGYIQSIGDNELVLCGSQDVLGTYFGTRTFALQDGTFEFADDGLWRFLMDEETWEYRSLTPTQNIRPPLLWKTAVKRRRDCGRHAIRDYGLG